VDRLRDAPLIYRIGNGLMGRNTEHRSANPVEPMMELEHREECVRQELLLPPPQVDAELRCELPCRSVGILECVR
jgi:hypothetical protein